MGRDIGWGTLYIEAARDFRAPIFYDSNNTGFYIDPNGTTVLNALTVNSINAGSHSHDSISYLGRISAETGRSVHRTGVYTFGTYTAANPGGNPPLTYPEVIAWGGGTGGTIQIAGDWISTTSTPLRVRSLRDCCQNWSSWSNIATSNESFTNNVDLRAPIFYDSNDTGYYTDPNSTSNMATIRMVGNLTINNSSPTIYLQDTDHNVSMIHCNSNIFYVLRGSTNSTSWATTNGYWPLEINLTNNDALFGRNLTAVGEVTAYSDARLKKDVETITDALGKVLKLRGVTYYRKDSEDNRRLTGVIAQEIQEVLPEVVSESINGEGESTLSVSYGNITGLLIEAIKDQQQIINQLQKDIEELKSVNKFSIVKFIKSIVKKILGK
jgi:hypothetical protein